LDKNKAGNNGFATSLLPVFYFSCLPGLSPLCSVLVSAGLKCPASLVPVCFVGGPVSGSWYKMLIRLDEEAGLMSDFLDAFVAHGGPEDMALFCTGRYAARVEMYLSPEAAQKAPELIARYRARPDSPPPIIKAVLLCGQGDAVARLLWHKRDLN
jgi:hypothetical protein